MANIREYNMNGTLILGIDHGYGNIKTAHRVFPTALIKSEKAPTFSKDYVGEYNRERTHFNHDICATAKGYEYYCYMILRHNKKCS